MSAVDLVETALASSDLQHSVKLVARPTETERIQAESFPWLTAWDLIEQWHH